ncbi:PhoD-like phosphatase-domain-containing protein [Aspergillus cavernicola]|uniref:PhoD-like phosphatase-domain-containing protein n=1 Tax=Aspergillus cavernicola TaxID=176166 RepID=A0ABR4IDT1_9EURO
MPPIPPPSYPHRIVLYHQTLRPDRGSYVSLLPLLNNHTGITHIILAAFHLNAPNPNHITLNDDPPEHSMYDPLWAEVPLLQQSGIKVMGMLGGAARGTFSCLDGDQAQFEAYYGPLLTMIRRHGLDGVDLDVEEPMSIAGIVRLIDRFKADLGEGFLITLAPVAAALLGIGNLSGFDYRELEGQRAGRIAWYNTQFYNGWGPAEDPRMYAAIVAQGWSPARVVYGLLTHPGNGSQGYVSQEVIGPVLAMLVERFPNFGGVMGWEYFNSMPAFLCPPFFHLVRSPFIRISTVRRSIMLTISSSVLIRLTSFLFLRWIPGHIFPPVVFTSLAIYLTSVLSSSPRNNNNGILKSLITGVPCRRSWATRLAIVINLLCGLFTLDFLLRGFILYPTSELRFSRVGYVSHNTADLLLREPDSVQLPVVVSYREAHAEDNDTSWIQVATIENLDDATDFTTTITFSNLSPSASYHYALSNNQTGIFVTSAAPDSSAAKKLSFLTSSCMKPNFPYDPRRHPLRIPGLDKMTTAVSSLRHLPPSFMLFLGDFIYIDVPQRFGSSVAHYRSEYRRIYSSPSWTWTAANLPWIHTLDDHEIANDWNHGNTTPPYPAAIDPYLHYHASINPPAPDTETSNTKSSYTSFTNGPASFFLLDTRSYRSPADETILGKLQLSALLSFLSAPEPSHIRWKIISSSVPFTRNWHAGTADTWGGFLSERAIVFDAMRSAQRTLGIRIVMLSGDRHEFAATHFPPLPPPPSFPPHNPPTEEPPKTNENQDLIEFCTGPLNMFYLPIRTYYQSGPDDVPIKYLPDGNTKFGLVQIEDGLVNSVPSSLLTYTLYIDESVVWKYRLSVPLAESKDHYQPAAAAAVGAEDGAEKAKSVSGLLPPGEVLVDESVEGWMDCFVGRVLGWSGLRVEYPAKDWVV